MSSHPQFTVAERVTLDGIGLHTGADAQVTLTPSDAGHIVFQRDGRETVARAENVSATQRCTTLGQGGAAVSTVEHLLAALSALSVTSVEVEVSGPELPILDGSAAPFVRAIECAGLRRVPGERTVLRLAAPIWLEEGESSLLAVPSSCFRVTTAVDYPHPLIGRQVVDTVIDATTFGRELAPARTFGFEHEVHALLERGLARGGSFENALVFMDDGTSTPPRFADEPARHKALDVVGDLALAGALPLAHIIAVRPSHHVNVAFARRLTEIHNGERQAQPGEFPDEGDST